MILAKFHIEIPVRQRKDGINGENLFTQMEIPFVPNVGMMICCLPDDEHRKIEAIYWSESDGLEIFFEFDERARLRRMLDAGWIVEK